MSPLTSYRRLLELAGPAYVLTAFVGRLPLAMSQLGTLLLVSSATGRYAVGGLAAGALAVANAVSAPVAGSLADRIGQRPVVLAQSLAGAAGLGVLVLLVHLHAGDAALVAIAALAGLALPQIGPLARVRWRPLTAGTGAQQRRLVDAAYSYEGAADEASFAVGPAVVGVAAVAVSPSGGLVTAAVLLAVFGTAFALHPSGRHVPAPGSGAIGGRLFTAAFAVLLLAQLAIGSLFGATQTGATALATAVGQPGAAGLVHAVLGVGSAAAGLATAFVPERFSQQRRILLAAVALFVLSWPLLLADALVPLTVTVLVLGLAVAPYMIGVFSLGERIVPPSRTGAAMTVLASATGVGYALGSSIAGRLADEHGHTAAFGVTVTVTGLAVLLAGTQQRRLDAATAAAQEAPDELDRSPDLHDLAAAR